MMQRPHHPDFMSRKGRSPAPSSRAPLLQDTVRLSANGLAKVLGDLEARVLRTVWSFGEPVPARVVHERLVLEHEISPLTTITVLNKLVAKRVLARAKRAELFHYRARQTEDEFMRHASRRVVEGILSLQPEAVTASFVEVLAERDFDRLEELVRLVRQRLGKRK